MKGHISGIQNVQLLEKGQLLSWENKASEKRLLLWDCTDGKLLQSHQGPPDYILDVHPDGRILCCNDESLRVEDCEGNEILRFQGHLDDISYGQFLCERWIVSGDWDGTMILWDSTTGEMYSKCEGHAGSVGGSILLSSEQILSWDDNTLRIWDITTGVQQKQLDGHTGAISTACRVGEQEFLSASNDGTIRLWNPQFHNSTRIENKHREAIVGSLLLKGNRVLTWSMDSTLRIWSREGGHCLHILEGHSDFVQGALLLPDERIISWSEDATIKIWDSETGSLLHTLNGHSDFIKGTCLLPNQKLLSWSFDASVRIWCLDSMTCVHVYKGDGGRVMGATPFPHNRILLWSKDRKFRIWVPQTNKVEEYSSQVAQQAHPSIWEAYTQVKNTSSPDSWSKGNRSVLRYPHHKNDADWHGEGYWKAIHGTKSTLMAINDKEIVFLELWDGGEKISP